MRQQNLPRWLMSILDGKARTGTIGGGFAQLLKLRPEFAERGKNPFGWGCRLGGLRIIRVSTVECLPWRQIGERSFLNASQDKLFVSVTLSRCGRRELP